MLRILRPLRFISHNPSMKILVNCLLESVGGLFNVSLVILLIWIMFAILFINLLSGYSGYCYGPDQYYNIKKVQCGCDPLNKPEGVDVFYKDGKWLNFDVNFDNILNAMISLFVLSTLEGWPDYMFQNIDGATPEEGPIKDNNYFVFYLFVIFIMVGSVFCVNLFVAIVSMNFHIAQERNKNKYINRE